MKYLVVNSSHVSFEIFDKEAVVVNFITGKYFGITGSGPDIWRVFENPCTIEQLTGLLKSVYTNITDRQIKNVIAFIDSLVKERLLVTVDKCENISIKLSVDITGEFLEPAIDIYDDLQELIVLDPVHDADPERGWPAQQTLIEPR